MKTIHTTSESSVRNAAKRFLRQVESTPFKKIRLVHPKLLKDGTRNIIRINHYLTLRAGTDGHQVVTIIYDHNGMFAVDKTAGCGYNKESEAIDMAFRAIEARPKGWLEYSSVVPGHKGGNYHSIAKSNMTLWKQQK